MANDNPSLYQRHRPTTFDEMVGADAAVRMLKGMVSGKGLPHAILLSGPSGTGKTTVARILKSHLKVSDSDFKEINAAEARGIDTIREIKGVMGLASMRAGGNRIWLLDEAHALTTPSQQAFLKMLEDTPKYVYFILATTDPNKVLPTVRSRCTEVKMALIGDKPMRELLKRVAKAEKFDLSDDVADRIVECAEGSGRKALVLLGSVMDIEDEDGQLDAILKNDVKRASFDLCRLLMNNRSVWADIAAVLKGIEEDAESVRRMVLGYVRAALLGGKNASRAYLVINSFRDDFFHGGPAALAAACFEVSTAK